MSDALLKNTFQKISPAYELVADITVATATTQVDFSGLNFGKDDDLLLVSSIIPTSVDGVNIYLYVNDNVTNSNYYRQQITADGTSVVSAREATPMIANTNISGASISVAKIKLANSGYFVWQSDVNTTLGSSIRIRSFYGSSIFTLTSITKLSIKSSSTNELGIGSRFQLYRLKAKKVADIIVSSATTQVDITSLNLDKDSEYMLVSDFTSAVANPNIYINDNTTATNYYTQRLTANSTVVSGDRFNIPYLLTIDSGYLTLAITKIKLTNNGYFVWQSDVTRSYNTPNPLLHKIYGTSTFTSTSITKISINAGTNGIGIGSRFTLYKMR